MSFEGIEWGVSVANYQDPGGRTGEFQSAQGMQGKRTLSKVWAGRAPGCAGRGTYFCPDCQVL